MMALATDHNKKWPQDKLFALTAESLLLIYISTYVKTTVRLTLGPPAEDIVVKTEVTESSYITSTTGLDI